MRVIEWLSHPNRRILLWLGTLLLSQSDGPIRISNIIEILGSSLSDATCVWFGGYQGTIITSSENSVTVEVPSLANVKLPVVAVPVGSSAASREFPVRVRVITRGRDPGGPGV